MKFYQIINIKPYYIFSDDISIISCHYRLWLYNYYFFNINNQLMKKKKVLKCTNTSFFSYTSRDLEQITQANDFIDFSSADVYFLQLPYKIKNRNIYICKLITYDACVLYEFNDNDYFLGLLNNKYLCCFELDEIKNQFLNKYIFNINILSYYTQLLNIIQSHKLLKELKERDD